MFSVAFHGALSRAEGGKLLLFSIEVSCNFFLTESARVLGYGRQLFFYGHRSYSIIAPARKVLDVRS